MSRNTSGYVTTLPNLVVISTGGSGSGDITILVCHIMKQDHVAKWSSNLIGESLKVRHHPNRFDGHKHCGIGDIVMVVCHVTLQNHMIKALYEFMAKSPLK